MRLVSAKDTLIIFAHAPAGFGHLRVTDALREGLPKSQNQPYVIGTDDELMAKLHRIFSVTSLGLFIQTRFQYGFLEDVITYLYRAFLRLRTQTLYNQLIDIVKNHNTKPKRVVVIATHFTLAHKVAALKNDLQKALNIPVYLVVQVTDDSPQHLWYVGNADLICVPSHPTRDGLLAYGITQTGYPPRITVLPYPVSIELTKEDSAAHKEKLAQVNPVNHIKIKIVIPISGAAVGQMYFLTLIKQLHKLSHRYEFHFIIKTTFYTKLFRQALKRLSYVKLHTARTSEDTVDLYEKEYREEHIAIEITKPSEQAFKALLHPSQRGGALLLFTKPIGRQEHDNIAFLRRNSLIPQESLMQELLHFALNNTPLHAQSHPLLHIAKEWRGLTLPNNPYLAALCIHYFLKQHLYVQMMNYKPSKRQEESPETSPNGVKLFWETLDTFLYKKER